MENNKDYEKSFLKGDQSGVILGISSDAIIEGLHHGDFIDSVSNGSDGSNDDKDQIVNEQDQSEIVNPAEKEYENNEPGIKETKPEEASSINDSSVDKEDQEIIDDGVLSNDKLKSTD